MLVACALAISQKPVTAKWAGLSTLNTRIGVALVLVKLTLWYVGKLETVTAWEVGKFETLTLGVQDDPTFHVPLCEAATVIGNGTFWTTTGATPDAVVGLLETKDRTMHPNPNPNVMNSILANRFILFSPSAAESRHERHIIDLNLGCQ